MKILVCGGRDFVDKEKIFGVLNELANKHSKFYNPFDNWLPEDIMIISGAAKGADSLAVDWAVVNFATFKEYPADWDRFGKRAGYLRNQEMLEKENPDLVVAFPGGKGTAMMVSLSYRHGCKVLDLRAVAK